MESPTLNELRETFLQRKVETKDNLEGFKERCAISGCTLTIHAWSDRKQRSIMNLALPKLLFLPSFFYSTKDSLNICTEVHEEILELFYKLFSRSSSQSKTSLACQQVPVMGFIVIVDILLLLSYLCFYFCVL